MEKKRAFPDSDSDSDSSSDGMSSPPHVSTATEAFPYYSEVMRDLIYEDDLEEIAAKIINCGGDIVETLKDFLRTLACGSKSTITNHKALEHFDKVKSIWGNKHFLGVLIKIPSCLPDLKRYAVMSKVSLSHNLVAKIRSDPSFKDDIFELKDKSTKMRNALSILIGYWSNEDMLSFMLSIGGRSLRSLLEVVKVDDLLPWGEVNGNTMSREFPTPTEGMTGSSPIDDLRNDLSIKELANRLLESEEAFSLADNYLAALKGCVDTTSYGYHLRHGFAAANFWTYSVILVPLVEALRRESSSLLVIFKKYSKTAQCLRCLDRLTRIQKDSLVKGVLESDDLAYQMRGALSVLFGYWSDFDVRELLHILYVSRFDLKGVVDDITYLVYFRGVLDDFKSLKNALAKKCPRDSEEYMDLFEKIKRAQEDREQVPNHAKKILNLPVPDRPAALIKVLLQNSNVILMEILGL